MIKDKDDEVATRDGDCGRRECKKHSCAVMGGSTANGGRVVTALQSIS